MFTVVIAEQVLLDTLEEYTLFLQPFRNTTNVVFCPWDTDQRNLSEAVHTLPKLVAGRSQWRAIVVCNECGLTQRNPFDLVQYTLPKKTEDMTDEAYMLLQRDAKFTAYEKAASLPLPRLMTYLCQSFTADRQDNVTDLQDSTLRAYWEESRKKHDLRTQILSTAETEFALPEEVICLARRTCKDTEQDFREAWESHHDIEYSTFYDRNLYFDKMRYVVFDLLPRNHGDYNFSYISFLYSLLLLANNPLPQNALRPNRVFQLICENDEKALCSLLQRYDDKLAATAQTLECRIRQMQEQKSTDAQKDAICSALCREVQIPVSSFGDADLNNIYFKVKQIGLASDVPTPEYGRWHSFFHNAKRSFLRYLRTPQRSLEKGTNILREMNQVDAQQVHLLDHFQREDILNYALSEEERMMQVETVDIHNPKGYLRKMQAEDHTIRDRLKKRMSRKMIAIATTIALCIFIIGFLPFLLTNRLSVDGGLSALFITLVALGVFLLAAYVCLLIFRWRLRKQVKHYNDTMLEIINEVESATVKYGEYLSHACNVMRGNCALNFYNKNDAPAILRHRIYKKHIQDIQQRRCELREFFARFIAENALADESTKACFEFNFDKPLDFLYPLPFETCRRHRMEFLQKGNFIDSPVDFVKRMQLRREELYD